MAFLTKSSDEVLANALAKVQAASNISSTSPGSVARALIEAVTSEIGDLYTVVDFNMSRTMLSTASGRMLDLIGSLYNVQRKTLTDLAAIDRSIGAFYFYIDAPYISDITIPIGTLVYTSLDDRVGRTYTYSTTEETSIPAGRLKAYASIRPMYNDAVFTAGPNTLTVIDPTYTQPIGTTVKATNPKAIEAQAGLEDDENYRLRIAKAIRTATGGTLDAVRLVGLGVGGVRDITVREAPYGLGSMEALVVAEDNTLAGSVILAAANAMNTVRPVGVRMFVRQPELVGLTVHASIVIKTGISADPDNISRRTQNGIIRYLNTLLIGTPLIYNQLIQAIMDATDVVSDVTITTLTANGVEVLRKNYTPESDQQIVPGEVLVSIAS